MKEKQSGKRKGIRGRDKGREFELSIAKVFARWSGTPFKRTPLSGGWDPNVVSGDVFCVAEYEPKDTDRIRFPFSIEAKDDESWDFVQLFKGTEKCPLKTFWRQATRDAKMTKKIPMLVFSKNWTPVFVMLQTPILERLSKIVGSSWKTLTYMVYSISPCEVIVFLLLDDFLKWADFEGVLKLNQ